MSTLLTSLTDGILGPNQNGRLYLWSGILTALVSWVLIPACGIISVYCGYKLSSETQRTTAGGAIAATGGLGVLIWLVYLATAL